MKKTIIALVTTSTLVIGGIALAHEHGDRDLSQINAAKVTMAQAITKAETTLGGKVIKVEFEREHGKSVYDIELVTDTKNYDVEIDALSGEIIKQREDHDD